MDVNAIRDLVIGGITKDEWRTKLAGHSVRMNDYAEVLFQDEAFTTSDRQYGIRVGVTRPEQLGLPQGGTSQQIFACAQRRGLHLCPLELAPALRLIALNQPKGPMLTIASKKTRDDDSYPNGFYLRHLNDGLWLRGYRATPDHLWPCDAAFVFQLSSP